MESNGTTKSLQADGIGTRSHVGEPSRFAIVLEETHGVAEAFADQGLRVVRHNHRAVNTSSTNRIAHEIKSNRVVFFYSEYPITGKNLLPGTEYAHFSQLITWARLCHDIGVPFLLFGSFGKKWRQDQLQTAIADGLLRLTHQRLCAFGLKIDNTMAAPSATCFVAASTFNVRPHRCQCIVKPEDHVLDYNTVCKPGQDRLKDKAMIDIGIKVITELFDYVPALAAKATDHRTLPDSIHNSAGATSSIPTQMRSAHARPLNAFPTEGRERQKIKEKARKAAGGEAVKKKFVVENHFDDCGADLSGLGRDIVMLAADYFIDDSNLESQFLDTASDDQSLHSCGGPAHVLYHGTTSDRDRLLREHEYTTSLALWFLQGSEATVDHWELDRPGLRVVPTFKEFMLLALQHDERDDFVEFCGGTGRTMTMCCRRHLKSGDHWDLLTGCDLSGPDLQGAWTYMEQRRPIVACMAMNASIDDQTLQMSACSCDSGQRNHDALATAQRRFCGQIALFQIQHGAYHIQHTSTNSNLGLPLFSTQPSKRC